MFPLFRNPYILREFSLLKWLIGRESQNEIIEPSWHVTRLENKIMLFCGVWNRRMLVNRPITEYASPVFHDCLPAYLSKDIESIQRRAMRISFPSLSYKEALDEAGLISLSVRRQSLTDKLFTKVTTDRENKLHHFLPEQRTCHYNLRKQRKFKPVFKINRCKSSFIIHNSQKLFN